MGLESVVSIANPYGLDGMGMKSWCGRDFLYLSGPVLWHAQPPVQWVPDLFLGTKKAWEWH